MTPDLSTAFFNYGQIHARSVKAIMLRLNSEPGFGDRLLTWLDDCSKCHLKAVDPERAKIAMCDMVALRISCYGFSVKDGKLKMTDLGGGRACFLMLCHALALITEYDQDLSARLTSIARQYADQQFENIRSQIVKT
ncbi:MAG: hypothetical protein KKC72_10665 [Alphaproteobacteria bacterium]|nr:hypothetical protein [Alphaproteobacteria bacterium]MBU1835514.1 hypothetical protein [Alphaproteobacteria bacterium]